MRFLDELDVQLIDPPASSRQALRKPRPVLSRGEHAAVQIASEWTSSILRSISAPGPDTQWGAFATEAGSCDVVRAHYSRNNNEFELAQTLSIFAFTIAIPGVWTAEQAEAIARENFKQAERIRFRLVANDGASAYGNQISDKTGRQHRDWVENLCWWSSGQKLSFLTLKTSPEPGMAVMTWGVDANRKWFPLYLD